MVGLLALNVVFERNDVSIEKAFARHRPEVCKAKFPLHELHSDVVCTRACP